MCMLLCLNFPDPELLKSKNTVPVEMCTTLLPMRFVLASLLGWKARFGVFFS